MARINTRRLMCLNAATIPTIATSGRLVWLLRSYSVFSRSGTVTRRGCSRRSNRFRCQNNPYHKSCEKTKWGDFSHKYLDTNKGSMKQFRLDPPLVEGDTTMANMKTGIGKNLRYHIRHELDWPIRSSIFLGNCRTLPLPFCGICRVDIEQQFKKENVEIKEQLEANTRRETVRPTLVSTGFPTIYTTHPKAPTSGAPMQAWPRSQTPMS